MLARTKAKYVTRTFKVYEHTLLVYNRISKEEETIQYRSTSERITAELGPEKVLLSSGTVSIGEKIYRMTTERFIELAEECVDE